MLDTTHLRDSGFTMTSLASEPVEYNPGRVLYTKSRLRQELGLIAMDQVSGTLAQPISWSSSNEI